MYVVAYAFPWNYEYRVLHVNAVTDFYKYLGGSFEHLSLGARELGPQTAKYIGPVDLSKNENGWVCLKEW